MPRNQPVIQMIHQLTAAGNRAGGAGRDAAVALRAQAGAVGSELGASLRLRELLRQPADLRLQIRAGLLRVVRTLRCEEAAVSVSVFFFWLGVVFLLQF